MELNGFYNYAAVKLLSLPQALTQTLKYYMFRASALTAHALRAPVRASLSLYVPARVTHANGSPLRINHNLSDKLARLLETAIKTLNK